MMRRTLFSKTRKRQRIDWFAGLALTCAGLLGLAWALHSPSAQADSAPDWLRAAARDKLPDYPKDTIAVVLVDEGEETIKDNGEIEYHARRAIKLLRPEAKEKYGSVWVNFSNDTKLTYLKAWTITPDGHELALKEKDAAEVGLTSFEVYSDYRAKTLQFPEANVGSVVGYEYVQKRRPYVLDEDWDFQEVVPVRESKFTLHLPPGWEFRTLFSNQSDLKPEELGGNQFSWQMNDVAPIEVEPEMPAWNTLAKGMYIKYFPTSPALRSKTSGSWKDIGIWYNGLTANSRTPTPAVQQEVAELTAGKSDPVEKMKALAGFVQQKIRYAAIEIGIGGFQPHPAGQVFEHQYGDCKDKATLLSSMLKEIGIDSYYVLINTERGVTLQDFPSTEFDHAILAIRLPDSVSNGTLYATVTDPKAGRLLFFDPTNPYVPFGYIPSYLQDTYALVITPDGGELIKTPLLAPPTNRLLRTAKFNLSATGNLSGDVEELRWGGPAGDIREQYLEVPPAQRPKILENFIGTFLANFTLTNATLGNLEQYDQNLVVNYKFFAEGYAKLAGNLLILRPRVLGSKDFNVEGLLNGKPRKYPIEFDEASRQDDMFDITLPTGYVADDLPKPVKEDCDYASYESSVEVSGGVLHYKRTYVVKDVLVPQQKLDVIRGFFREVANDERSSAVLKRAGT
jgi:transglutaminase-like putative cysteine protease